MAVRNAMLSLLLLLPAAAEAAPITAVDANVVVIDVTKVQVAQNLPGLCRVEGVISKIWEGRKFRAGESLTLKVPCGVDLRLQQRPAEIARLIDPDVLKRSKAGIAFLDGNGEFIWQESARLYGGFGRVAGYRVYDGVALPIQPQRL
ncbi:MAG TPA: hypothetical protein VHM27_12900 [Rhizomicrobium sp.]|nr:hypothetical protein [Rhizomicrobium sp.]